MRYSLEQLEILVAVAKTEGFSAAARQIGKTQSTVSSAIANLELDLGVQLFDRSKKIASLTACGQQLVIEAKEILDRCMVLEGHARSLSEEIESELVLAIEVPYNTLTEPLREFTLKFPYVDLNFRHPLRADASTLLLDGTAQLGVAFAQPKYPAELGFSQMGKLILTHVVGRGHALAGLKSIRFADLNVHRRLAYSAHSNRLPTTEYLDSTSCWRAESYLALLEMAKSGLGWTSLPRQMIRDELERGDLVELQLTAYPFTDWLLGVDLIWNKSAPLGKAGTWLKSHLERYKIWEVDRNGNPTTL